MQLRTHDSNRSNWQGDDRGGDSHARGYEMRLKERGGNGDGDDAKTAVLTVVTAADAAASAVSFFLGTSASSSIHRGSIVRSDHRSSFSHEFPPLAFAKRTRPTGAPWRKQYDEMLRPHCRMKRQGMSALGTAVVRLPSPSLPWLMLRSAIRARPVSLHVSVLGWCCRRRRRGAAAEEKLHRRDCRTTQEDAAAQKSLQIIRVAARAMAMSSFAGSSVVRSAQLEREER